MDSIKQKYQCFCRFVPIIYVVTQHRCFLSSEEAVSCHSCSYNMKTTSTHWDDWSQETLGCISLWSKLQFCCYLIMSWMLYGIVHLLSIIRHTHSKKYHFLPGNKPSKTRCALINLTKLTCRTMTFKTQWANTMESSKVDNAACVLSFSGMFWYFSCNWNESGRQCYFVQFYFKWKERKKKNQGP